MNNTIRSDQLDKVCVNCDSWKAFAVATDAALAAAREELCFQACLTKGLMPYQERAVKAEADLAAARTELVELLKLLDSAQYFVPSGLLRDRIDDALTPVDQP